MHASKAKLESYTSITRSNLEEKMIEKSLHVAQSRRPGERVKGLVGFPKKGDAY